MDTETREQASSTHIHRALAKRGETVTNKVQTLTEKAQESKDVLDHITGSMIDAWFDAESTLDSHLKSLRSKKVSIGIEAKQLIASFLVVTSIFGDTKQAAKLDTLKEFVSVCERLEKLKESGILDSVTDTMKGLK